MSRADLAALDLNLLVVLDALLAVRELVRFDAEDRSRPVRVWDHVSGDLVERAEDDLDLRSCHTLGLWWVVLEDPAYGPMLRLARDREGRDPLPTPAEGRVQAEMALQKTEQALLVAEHEKLLAEQRLGDEIEARREAESEVERLKEALARARRGG